MNESKTIIRLHLPAIPHTITNNSYSNCAFTGKVLRFSRMMMSLGYEVYHYGIETSESGATKQIDLMTKKEWNDLRYESYKCLHINLTDKEIHDKLNDKMQFIGDLGNITTPLYIEFNKRLKKELIKNYRNVKTDIICLPFGEAHESAIVNLSYLCVESGIGYNGSYEKYRIFESYAYKNYVLGNEQINYPNNYWFTIPNYYDISEWTLKTHDIDTPISIGYLGRICHIKGCIIIVELAKKFPDIEFIICGQGDPTPYLTEKNIKYKPPICGKERNEYLGSLTALIAPSLYLEPFCGVCVEAQLCGTPVMSNDFGASVETIENFKTGILAHTLQDYILGVTMAIENKFDRNYIRNRSAKIYDMYNIAHSYDYAFKCILDIYNGTNGWYSSTCHLVNNNK